jgi:hypothetical protein
LVLVQAHDAPPVKHLRAAFLQGFVEKGGPRLIRLQHRKFHDKFMNTTYHTSQQLPYPAVQSSVWSRPLSALARLSALTPLAALTMAVRVSDTRLVSRFVSDMVIEAQGGSSG